MFRGSAEDRRKRQRIAVALRCLVLWCLPENQFPHPGWTSVAPVDGRRDGAAKAPAPGVYLRGPRRHRRGRRPEKPPLRAVERTLIKTHTGRAGQEAVGATRRRGRRRRAEAEPGVDIKLQVVLQSGVSRRATIT